MARVPRGESFSFEHMTEVATTASALNLDPLAVRIRNPTDRPRYFLVEGGPAAVCVELVLGAVEGRTALLAFVGAGLERALVFSRKGRLGPLVQDHSLFGPRQRSDGRVRLGHAPSNPLRY